MSAQIIPIADEATLLKRAHHLQSEQGRAISLAWEHIQRSKRHRAAGQHDAADRYLRHAETVLEQGS